MLANELLALAQTLEGEFFTDQTIRTLYSTDASAYKEMPLAVATPKSREDVKKIIRFAHTHKVSIIPRTAGTSLGGQVVGGGIIVDVSKHWRNILELNVAEKWVRVQPGVNLDELNKFLKPHKLFFGPETSTSNRCMIGGMVGNNSCGSHSVIYGTTRDHVLEIKTILSDGNEAEFKAISKEEFSEKCKLNTLEGKVHRHLYDILSKPENQEEIRNEFPKPSVRRRNTGYAIDEMLETEVFTDQPIFPVTFADRSGKRMFNLSKLLAGSEGTLAFSTEIKLNLVDAPKPVVAVVAVHLNSIYEACKANLIALKYKPGAVELMDDIVLQCAKKNIEQQKNLFFVQGDPVALLCVEFARDTKEEIEQLAREMEAEMRANNYGYHFPVLVGDQVKSVWDLRKAGLGLLANIAGDEKAVPCIEDTAVDVQDQPEYLLEFEQIMTKYGMQCVYYAHIGDGELHLRPVLDLKTEKGQQLFFDITNDVATLVKKYRGSLSGEHGDGRVRGEFIPKMIGQKNYDLLCDLKATWDPNNILNPGKIVHTPKMNEFLRYKRGQVTIQPNTVFRFDESQGILRLAEKCNGAGDCRKTHVIGGTMCPSFQATHNEKDTTRARANILREFLTNSSKLNKFDHEEIKEVMDLCLSCKGCKSECPSNVDVGKMKAEFLQHYYDAHGVPLRSWAIGNISKLNALGSLVPSVANFFMNNAITGGALKSVLGVAKKRSLPNIYKITFRNWFEKIGCELRVASGELPTTHNSQPTTKKVNIFCDEFTNYNDVEIGITMVKLLVKLGYKVEMPKHVESGRAYLSKGMVRDAQKLAQKNVTMLKDVITAYAPLIGIEPSAILTFRDEYLSLVSQDLLPDAEKLAKNCFTIDEFLAKEIFKGNITSDQFTEEPKSIKLHGHCHQKALSGVSHTQKLLTLPKNYKIETIPSGCCGMAGSFGYEEEHYDISMKVGELVLFPAIRKDSECEVAAPGTSCRHQIKDGTGRLAKHPVEILFEALK
jgi:FAD/FMN-containing dehydrogenase/Fe-S oxidoreductase